MNIEKIIRYSTCTFLDMDGPFNNSNTIIFKNPVLTMTTNHFHTFGKCFIIFLKGEWIF